MSVNDRSHLSIGEVLSLLQEEFPDVTISKIRFLESQGLLDPERTPSGYRKFYEADIDRLRWILRQQRENFLPLKVIKDRLEGIPFDQVIDVNSDVPSAASPARGAAPANGVGERAASAAASAGSAPPPSVDVAPASPDPADSAASAGSAAPPPPPPPPAAPPAPPDPPRAKAPEPPEPGKAAAKAESPRSRGRSSGGGKASKGSGGKGS